MEKGLISATKNNVLINTRSVDVRNRKTIVAGMEVLLIIVLIAVSLFYNPSVHNIEQTLICVGWLAISVTVSLFVLLMLLLRRINYFVVFLLLASMFSFGQSVTVCLNMKIGYTGILNISNGYFDSAVIFRASLHVMKAMVAMALGYTLLYNDGVVKARSHLQSSDTPRSLRCLGWLLIAISIIPTFYLVIKDVIILKSDIYANSKYEVTGLDKIFTLISGFFDAGVILLLICEKRKFYKTVLWVVLLMYMVMQIAGGSRFDVFKYMALLVVIFFDNHKKIKFKHIVFFILGVLFIGLLFSVVSTVRQVKLNSIGDYIVYIFESFSENNIFSRVLYEAGITQVFNTLVYSKCPTVVDYCYGASLYKIFLGWIPNLGFWSVHPTGISTEVVFSPLYANFGLGSSLWAEAYWNFGEIGSYIFLFVLGGLFSRLIRRQDQALQSGNYVVQFIIYYFMFYFVISVRSDMVQIGRDMLYYVGMPLVVFNLLRGKRRLRKIYVVNN